MGSLSDRPLPRRRLRLLRVEFQVSPDSRCVVRTVLEWRNDQQFVGEARGTDTHQGRLRAGCLATLEAVERASDGFLSLELRGVKAVRAFDTQVVIVSIRARTEDDTYTLLGSQEAPDGELVRGSAMAVLDALNRVLAAHLGRNG